jgi:hypothetical protein
MRYHKMSEKQLLMHSVRVRLAWFHKAEELGSASAACDFYGIPRRTYCYWTSASLVRTKPSPACMNCLEH